MNAINSIHKDQKIIGTKLDDSKSPRHAETKPWMTCYRVRERVMFLDAAGITRHHGQSLGVVRKNDAPTSYFESTICIHFARWEFSIVHSFVDYCTVSRNFIMLIMFFLPSLKRCRWINTKIKLWHNREFEVEGVTATSLRPLPSKDWNGTGISLSACILTWKKRGEITTYETNCLKICRGQLSQFPGWQLYFIGRLTTGQIVPLTRCPLVTLWNRNLINAFLHDISAVHRWLSQKLTFPWKIVVGRLLSFLKWLFRSRIDYCLCPSLGDLFLGA